MHFTPSLFDKHMVDTCKAVPKRFTLCPLPYHMDDQTRINIVASRLPSLVAVVSEQAIGRFGIRPPSSQVCHDAKESLKGQPQISCPQTIAQVGWSTAMTRGVPSPVMRRKQSDRGKTTGSLTAKITRHPIARSFHC